MLRNIMMTGTAICLSMGSGLARADHDDELRYVVGGAIIGAALGELVYSTGHRSHVVVDYGYSPYRYYPRDYGYIYRRDYGYARGFAPGYRGHGFRQGRGHRHGHWNGRHRHR